MIDWEFTSEAESERFLNEITANGIEENEVQKAFDAFQKALSHVLMYEVWRTIPGVTLMWNEEEQDFALKGIRLKQ